MKKILISGSHPVERYINAVKAAGGEPTALYCPDASLVSDFDGLILAGGGDADPMLFGEEDTGVCGGIDRARDDAELAVFRAFFDAGKPILGICRGHQMINVALGGTLYQELPGEYVDLHRGGQWHTVTNEPGCVMYRLYGRECVVNSWHHQGVKRLAEGLIPCEYSPEGIVEGFYHEQAPIWGVQWHPEKFIAPEKRIPEAIDPLPFVISWMEDPWQELQHE